MRQASAVAENSQGGRRTHRVLINKSAAWEWAGLGGEVAALRRSSSGGSVPPGGSLWLPGARAEFPGLLPESLCALRQVQSGSSLFLRDGFDDAQQLSSVSSICGKQLVFNDCGFFWPYLSVWLMEARNRCCRTFKLINCIPHCVVVVSLWSDIMGFLVKLDPSWIESLNGQKCLHQTIKSWQINGFSLDFYFNALFDIWMTHISIRIARTANICRTATASSSSTQCQQHCQAE